MSWSSSVRFSFSSEMVATAWVTPLSSCETVTWPWTSWERKPIGMDLMGRVRACASRLRSGNSWLLSERALLPCACCLIMNSIGRSVEVIPERDGRGELRAESLPKASFHGGRIWGFAMRASKRGKVGKGFDRDTKRGNVEIVCEM